MIVKKNEKVAFILWYHYGRRFSVLSDYLNCKTLYVKHLIRSRGLLWHLFFWIDYSYKALYTLFFLIYNKPEVVIATSPPSLCPIFCGIYCIVFKKRFVVDAHNSAFRKPWVSIPFYLKILKFATVVIVHNYEYEAYLRKKYNKIKFQTLHDRIPDFDSISRNKMFKKERYFLVIFSYAADEPVVEILEAIKLFLSKKDFNVVFKITGNYKKRFDLYEQYHNVDGIEFLGFVNDKEYDNLLNNAFGMIALTTSPMVQQCAAIEAIGAEVPIIVSLTDTNKRLFFKGGILTESEDSSIQRAVIEFIQNRKELYKGIRNIKAFWQQEWDKDFKKLNKIVKFMAYK